ncbi:Etfdh [Symbiodinium natans]|uniref:Etfdh protein n=1 Tax=Symbiodinium natans TaxID=878477 RepID=A0A812LJB0_9DINO|nr:Etfdh [Symbiodinium natans]
MDAGLRLQAPGLDGAQQTSTHLKMRCFPRGLSRCAKPRRRSRIYNSEDEEAGPLKGKMKDNGLVDFTYEVHLYYEPQ